VSVTFQMRSKGVLSIIACDVMLAGAATVPFSSPPAGASN